MTLHLYVGISTLLRDPLLFPTLFWDLTHQFQRATRQLTTFYPFLEYFALKYAKIIGMTHLAKRASRIGSSRRPAFFFRLLAVSALPKKFC